MAEHVLETRIQLRYGTYTQWMNSDIILKRGEAAVASFPRYQTLENLTNGEPDNTPPAIGIKIGDGESYFYQLPWVQAISADVYNWAKASTKPTYTAQEIQGLQNYVENLVGNQGGETTIAPRIYQLIEGTGDNQHKYYLRYKENDEEAPWQIDTSTYIDLNDLVTVVNWIGTYNLTEYPSLLSRTGDQVRAFLQTLNANDSERENQFVTAVTEENGIITVSRARPNFSNLSGVASVSQGGTGQTSFAEDAVLLGNGTNPLHTREIADTIAANNKLVPNYLIKAYVDNAVAGLEGAMHFIGEATVAPIGMANPQVSDYNFNNAQPGDVVLWEQKEYVWTGGNWRLLGDEGSYAVKGSIRDADIDVDANIQQSKIYNLTDSLASKVDKEQGKGLSSNDYTIEDKQKLANIEAGAQVNSIEHILLNDVEAVPHEVNNIPHTVELNIKEFDDESRLKLATIEEGANVNIIEGITLNNNAQLPNNNKIVNLTINEFTKEDEAKLDNIEAGAQVNIIERIKVDGTEFYPDNNKVVEIATDPHTEHENVIESIVINGTEYPPDQNKQVNITIDQAALNLNVLEGAEIPTANGASTTDVAVVDKKLQLARIAVTSNVTDLSQTQDTYIILNCGSSTDVI